MRRCIKSVEVLGSQKRGSHPAIVFQPSWLYLVCFSYKILKYWSKFLFDLVLSCPAWDCFCTHMQGCKDLSSAWSTQAYFLNERSIRWSDSSPCAGAITQERPVACWAHNKYSWTASQPTPTRQEDRRGIRQRLLFDVFLLLSRPLCLSSLRTLRGVRVRAAALLGVMIESWALT